eukprot:CAMPEP_0197457980 /NCGR_PEP_ID=MMETSP1175-20131217/47475_1 /TAXON_ID=1003142 /ORGANISM="Triceratium dubium, Strain CCMP147" /LENGTH=65 /DNA_ID=CAMNT_0042992483 /DNA_START=326 /DNA_END=523 /DNA_ORIENTATION=+
MKSSLDSAMFAKNKHISLYKELMNKYSPHIVVGPLGREDEEHHELRLIVLATTSNKQLEECLASA